MKNEDPDNREKGYILMRSILDYGMGVMIFALGIFFIISPRLGFNFNIDSFFRYFFAGLCMLYGGWRTYRGYKKNYYH